LNCEIIWKIWKKSKLNIVKKEKKKWKKTMQPITF
jgi:hypothetical protein